MQRSFTACSICDKPFVPRFTYQTEATEQGTRHYCSVGCRAPELDGRARTAKSQHQCTACGVAFTIEYAYQVLNVGKARKMACSEACRAALLEPAPSAPVGKAPRVIAVLNQKGGTGKTTTSVQVAAGLAELGERTLLVDLDAQGSVGVSLGVKSERSLYHVLVDGMAPERVTVTVRKNLDVLTSDQSMAAAELELVNAPDRAHVLRRRLASIAAAGSPYDYVVLDCAPSLSLLNQNALVFAQEVLIPVSCDYLALVGVKQILRTLRHVNDVLLHPIEVLGVLPTFYDTRNRISKQSVEALKGYFKDRVLPPIRVNAKLKEAPSHKKTIFEYAPESHGAEDYLAVVAWLRARAPASAKVDAEALAVATARRVTT